MDWGVGFGAKNGQVRDSKEQHSNVLVEQFLQKKNNLLACKDMTTWTIQRMTLQVYSTGGFVL